MKHARDISELQDEAPARPRAHAAPADDASPVAVPAGAHVAAVSGLLSASSGPVAGDRRWRIAIGSLAGLALVALALFLAAWWGWLQLPGPLQDRVNLLGDPHARVGVLNADDAPVEAGSFRLVLNQQPVVDAGSRTCAIQFENPPGNGYNVRLDLVLDETGETLASTRLVEPGRYVETVELSRQLEVGTYPMTAQVSVLSGADEITQVTSEVTVVVQ